MLIAIAKFAMAWFMFICFVLFLIHVIFDVWLLGLEYNVWIWRTIYITFFVRLGLVIYDTWFNF